MTTPFYRIRLTSRSAKALRLHKLVWRDNGKAGMVTFYVDIGFYSSPEEAEGDRRKYASKVVSAKVVRQTRLYE